jgi:hypothetical protein
MQKKETLHVIFPISFFSICDQIWITAFIHSCGSDAFFHPHNGADACVSHDVKALVCSWDYWASIAG